VCVCVCPNAPRESCVVGGERRGRRRRRKKREGKRGNEVFVVGHGALAAGGDPPSN